MSKTKYKILNIATVLIPMISILLYIFITSNKNLKIVLDAPRLSLNDVSEEYDFIIDENKYIEYNFKEKYIIVNYPGEIKYENVISENQIKVPLTEKLFIGKNLYSINEEKIEKLDLNKMLKDSMFEKKFVSGLGMMISLLGVLILVLMVSKKMNIMMKHKRLSVLLSSLTLSVVFLILSTITTQLYLIFITFTISWGAYYIEWLVYRKKNNLPLHEDVETVKVVIKNE